MLRCVILFAVASMALSLGSAQAATVAMGTPVTSIVPGKVDVPLTITTGATETLSGFEFTIEYDGDCWSLVEVVPGAALTARTSDLLSFSTSTIVSGLYAPTNKTLKIIGVITDTGPPGTGECLPASSIHEVALMRFTPNSPVPVTCDAVLGWNALAPFGDPETAVLTCAGTEVALPGTSCFPNQGTLLPFCFVAGHVGYFSDPVTKHVPDVTMDDCPAPPGVITPLSPNTGNYLLVLAPGGSPTPLCASKPGDTAVDRLAVNPADWLACLRHVNFFTVLPPENRYACDNNSNLSLDVTDCTRIRDELLAPGGIDLANPVRTWKFDVDVTGTTFPSPLQNPGTATCPSVAKEIRAYLNGDCTGGWPSNVPKPGPSQIAISLEPAQVNPGEVTIALKADVGKEPLETLLFALEYDASQLEYVGMLPGDRAKEFAFGDNPSEAGILRVVAAGWKEPAKVSGEMLQLRFRVLGSRMSIIRVVEMTVNELPALNLPSLELTTNPNTVSALPGQYFLSGYPNPFNPSITVEFGVPRSAGSVPGSVKVIDVAGRHVRTLQAGSLTPGFHSVVWNGLDDGGNQAQTGIYFVQARLGDWKQVYKVTLLK